MRTYLSTEDIFIVLPFHHSLPVVFYPTVMHMQRVFSQNESDFHLEGQEKQNFIDIPSSNFHDNGLFSKPAL